MKKTRLHLYTIVAFYTNTLNVVFQMITNPKLLSAGNSSEIKTLSNCTSLTMTEIVRVHLMKY